MKVSLSLFILSITGSFAFLSPSPRAVSKTALQYDIQRDNDGDPNVWSILASTEQWISSTLKHAQREGNPLSRKEVSYVCETSPEISMVLANVFRKCKEARQMGESHAQEQEWLVDHEKDGELSLLENCVSTAQSAL